MRVSKEQAVNYINQCGEDMVLVSARDWCNLTGRRLGYVTRHKSAMHIEPAFAERQIRIRKRTMPNPDFAEKLTTHVKNMGIATPTTLLVEIRKRSGVRFTASTIRTWLKGTFKPRLRAQKALRDALGFNYDYDNWPEG